MCRDQLRTVKHATNLYRMQCCKFELEFPNYGRTNLRKLNGCNDRLRFDCCVNGPVPGNVRRCRRQRQGFVFEMLATTKQSITLEFGNLTRGWTCERRPVFLRLAYQ